MEHHKLSIRKADLLDELNDLRVRRGIAYRAGDLISLENVHLEMKAFWLRNGWNENEAQEDYLIHVKECEIPYKDTADVLTAIKGSLLLFMYN